jgi:acyl carrier protein
VQVAVLPIRWPKFVARLPHGAAPPLLEAFSSAARPATDGRERLAADLVAARPEARVEMLADFVARQLTQVLGFGPSTRIDPRRNFGDLGVDSLLAVDLRNRLEAGLDLSLPATLLFDHPNLEALVTHLNGALGDTGEVPPSEPPASAEEAFAELSEEEVARLLAAEIDALSPE